MSGPPQITCRRRRDLAKQGDAIQLIEQRACDRCGKPFMPRTGSGGSVQRFCSADCRLSFHTERLRSQRIGLYAGQLAQEPTPFEQAERLIAKLTLDERRRLIERLLADLPSESPDTEPTLLLEPTKAAAGAPGAEKGHPSVLRLCTRPLREQP
jgi:hypothetical protein